MWHEVTPDIRPVIRRPDLLPVDFGIQAHYLRDDFPVARTYDTVKARVAGCPYPIYAIDDQTAILVNGDEIRVVGEGQHVLFEPA